MKSALLIVALLVQTSLGQIAPAPEVPAVATPVAEVPAVAAPVAEVPAVATPVAETPVAEGPVSDKVTKSQDRAGVETITSGIGVGIAGLQDILDGITNANEPPPTPSEGFQYTNIRLETSTPMGMIDPAEYGAAEAGSESWMDKLRPWKKQDTVVNTPVPVAPASVSGVSGGAVLSSYEGPKTPPVDPQSEAGMLLAKQELLMALLEDTEEALAARQG